MNQKSPIPTPHQLSESEALALVATAHHLPTGILILSPIGEILYVNRRFDQIIGINLTDRLHNSVLDSCSRHNRLFCEILKGAVEGKQAWQGELSLARENGEPLWIDLAISPVTDFGGDISHFAVVCEDVTNTKALLLDLKKSEGRYRDIFESVGIAIWEQDFSAVRAWALQMQQDGVSDFHEYFQQHPDMRKTVAGMVEILDVNDFSLTLMGVKSKSQLLGPLDKHCQPETLLAVPKLVQAMADGVAHFEIETVARTARGQRLDVLVGMTFPNPEDSYKHVLVTMKDISPRIRAEKEAQHMRRFLFSIVDNIPLMVFVKDVRDFRMVFWNKHGEKLTGLSRHDLIGKTDFDFWPEEQAQFFREADEKVVREGRFVDIPEEPLTDAKGNIRLLHTRKMVLTNDHGEPEYLLGISEDITQDKADEENRQNLEREINQARQLESVGSLAAGIAHEINTPIQFVGDNVRFLAESVEALLSMKPKTYDLFQAISDQEIQNKLVNGLKQAEDDLDIAYLTEEIPKAIEQTLDGVHRVATIVRAMKDFAHVGGKDWTSADLHKMLQSTLTVARNEYKYVADIVTNFDPDLPAIDCVQSQLNQVWLNLLVNASHAIGERVGDSGERGTITISTSRNEDSIKVAISDNGCGIPDKIRNRIWDHFFTTKEVGRGTGQGLSVVCSIVDKHSGSISLDSEVGKGTTFTVKLPIQQEETDLLEEDPETPDESLTTAAE